MKKAVKIIVVCLVLIAIVIGIIFGIKYIGESANKVNEEYEKDKEKLQESYDNFSGYIAEYNEARTELATLMESARYYEDFPKVSESLNSFFASYDELINKIMISVSNLDEACKREYMEEEYSSMCGSYSIPYEQMLNNYISNDIYYYNELITKYNTWVGEEKYPTFNSKYVNDLIDHNKDGIEDGYVYLDGGGEENE